MKKGKISNYKNGIGQILSEGNTYNFNINVVRANDVADGVNVEFELAIIEAIAKLMAIR